MAAKKKKKKAARKTSKRSKRPSIKVQSQLVPKMTLDMPLDAKQTKAIKRCIEKGRLRITIGKVDLATGRIGDGWIYD